MLITDDFVLLNFPKTGTTFVRKVIKKVYNDRLKELLVPKSVERQRSPHGTYSQIPGEHQGKTIVSIVRNPFDRYVSQYVFKWYADWPPERLEILKGNYPTFPEISFTEYLDMSDRFSKINILREHGVSTNTNIGIQTVQFVEYYSSKPERDLQQLVQGHADFLLTLPKIYFLRQEFLRDDLYNLLASLIEDQSRLRIIYSETAENVSRRSHEKDWRQYWTADLLQKYSEKERFLLNLFPEYKQHDTI
jgi:hypothetical protein